MAEITDVAIVGGGAAGCAAAYYLAQEGVQVTIIERAGIGSQASGYAAGGLNPLQGTGIPGPLSDFAGESFQMHTQLWDQLKESTGIDCHGKVVPQLKVAFQEEELAELHESFDTLSKGKDFEVRWLEPKEHLSIEPRLSSEIIRALYIHGNAVVNSRLFTEALAKGAENLGAKQRPGNVTRLKVSGGRATGVVLEDGEIDCGRLILAMGPWSRWAESWLGAYIPVDPLKGDILRLKLPGPPLAIEVSGGGGSLYPRDDGLVWCGATEDWKGFDMEPSETAKASLMERSVRLAPDLGRSELVKHTSCLRPVTPDWLPIIGAVPGYENVYLATGAGKKGILLSPGMGKAVSDLVTQGYTSLSIGAYGPDRFAGPKG